MDRISEQQFQEAKSWIPKLENEIRKRKELINQYYEQQRQENFKKAVEAANQKAIVFRKEFSTLAQSAIVSKYGSLEEYVEEKKTAPEILKRQLEFYLSGSQFLPFITNCGLNFSITNNKKQSASFYDRPNTFGDNDRIFKGNFFKILREVINENGGDEKFCHTYYLTPPALNQVIYFHFASEMELLKLLQFSGSTMKFTFRYDSASF